MKHTVITIVALLSIPVCAQEFDLLDLELEDLLKIELSGESVQHIKLSQPSITSNSFAQENLWLPFSIEVISSDSISAKNIKNVVQAAEAMTGILSGESPSEPYSFSMRGYNRDSIDVSYDGISMGLSTLNMRP